MKKIIKLYIFINMFLCFFVAELKAHIQTPLSAVHDLDNNLIEIPNKAGKWTIVNYWTQWCRPCKKEIPALNAFARKNKDTVILVGVHSERVEQDALVQITKALNIQFPILLKDPIAMIPNLVGTPSTYLVSPTGTVHGPLVGPQTERSLLKAIEKYS